jgi:hypothetical protein
MVALEQLQAALAAQHAAGDMTHMPQIFEDQLLCCCSPADPNPGRKVWKAHVWRAAQNTFVPIETGFAATSLECSPQAWREPDGQVCLTLISDETGDLALHRFAGTDLHTLAPSGTPIPARAGYESRDLRLQVTKFAAYSDAQTKAKRVGLSHHALLIDFKQPASRRVYIVKDYRVVLHAASVGPRTLTTTLSRAGQFVSLLIDLQNPMLAHKILLPDAAAPYKAYVHNELLFHAVRQSEQFEDRRLAITDQFTLVPVPLFDYVFALEDFFANPDAAPPGAFLP